VKKTVDSVTEKPRILARVLAEELSTVRVAGGVLSCSETGVNKGPGWDLTNLSGDNDGPVPD
jgi:hypothetical protein